MANRHFGEIGDIWKHLPLAEILAIEKPRYYCESHAGSARYPLSHSLERDYGIYYFFEHASHDPFLSNTTFFKLLQTFATDKTLTIYPGSPFIAMTLLNQFINKFIFCDHDTESLQDICAAADEYHINPDKIEAVKADGIDTIEHLISNSSSANAHDMFALLDPYQPFEKSPRGIDSVELFYYLTRRDIKTVLWYGYDRIDQRDEILHRVQKPFIDADLDISDRNLWCGDIQLTAIHDKTFDVDPGVLGCGIVCGNLSEKSLSTCINLGKAMEDLYQTARFPQGQSGEIRFFDIPLLAKPLLESLA